MGNALFAVGYRIYLTGVGRGMHTRSINGVRESQVHPHSFFTEEQGVKAFEFTGDIRIIPVPFLEDNLAYIVLNTKSGNYVLVDPADFDAVEEVKVAYGVQGAPEAILTTHKHWDHAGNNQRYAEQYPGLRIISGTNEPVYASNENLDDGTSTELLDGKMKVEAFETPCHTAAHNMFIVTLQEQKLIFTGDCLFEGGVGMFFEGNADQMYDILSNLFTQRITTAEEQENTFLFFGHDYGWKNYMWAHDHLFAQKDMPEQSDRVQNLIKAKSSVDQRN